MMNALWAKVLVVAAALVLVAAGLWYAARPEASEQGPVACTADAMQCPDGSWVGRTGPHCEFICPAVASTTVSTSTQTGSSGGGFAEYTSGLQGTVLAGPTCPVERTPPDPSCADKPIATNIWVSRKINPQQVIATTNSNTQGMFKISLPPGEYVLQAGSSGTPYPRCTTTTATVGPTGYTVVAISCDTGIR